ncbi:MAG: hypothetical protein LBE08_11990 [Bifidobacteriaceae bacterium]|jgi:hypothetical protein|nr:hypothetical protein [Bifidobacteriaceae bacterium]
MTILKNRAARRAGIGLGAALSELTFNVYLNDDPTPVASITPDSFVLQ